MPPNLKAAVSVLHDYGQRSTLHGLSHMHQSGDPWRRAFWVILTFGGCAACFYHTYATISNYLESPITSIFRDEGVSATFPDVTICNLKPVSETLLHTPSERSLLFQHLENNWNFFRNWLPEKRKRRFNETRVDYKLRQRDLFKTYMDVFWATDDTRDFGQSDLHMLLSCVYKGRQCNSDNLKLIQHNRYWNCYTFLPTNGDRSIDSSDQNSGLKLILFTDSNFDDDRLNQQTLYERKKSADDEMHRPYDLEEYLSVGDRTMNQVLTGNSWEAEGLRIFVHREGQHPMTTGLAYDISSGASTTIEFSEVQVNALNIPPEHVCQEKTPDEILYVRFFGDNSTGVGFKNYSLTQSLAVIEAKQRMVYETCSCYSHLLPFRHNTSTLCMFAPHGERHEPSRALLDRMNCHDAAYQEAESRTADLMQTMEGYTPCNNWKLHATKTEVSWPRNDELIDFVNYIVLPRFTEPKEYKSSRLNHLLGSSNSSRGQSVLKNLFNATCKPGGLNSSLEDAWCLSKHKLITNVARVWIKPDSPRAAVYMEDYSYDWPEALSEIGGIFGLWMGISLLSVCEFVELVFILFKACSTKDSDDRRLMRLPGVCSGGAGAASGLTAGELENLLRQVLVNQSLEEEQELANFWAARGFKQQQSLDESAELQTTAAEYRNSPTYRRPMQFSPPQQQQQQQGKQQQN
ncbi:hypothetical protein BOX15_Mlig018669g1 [Macrostomum lignano]|uniref:Uncharacterized protein n=1 Tax=Macrostomum lignano TaxID=282301 RepID=A0A267EVJ3_9PLAT|nr:hypothetical protein BOX15_Mlig018669g1 [Macrostomum lignano]